MLTFAADELAYTSLSQYGPLYLNKAVGMSVEDTGWGAALPHLVSVGSKLLVGPINDHLLSLVICDEGRRTKMWACISTSGAILCFSTLALLPVLRAAELVTVPSWFLEVVFTSVNAFTSLAFLGIIKSAMMVCYLCREYASNKGISRSHSTTPTCS